MSTWETTAAHLHDGSQPAEVLTARSERAAAEAAQALADLGRHLDELRAAGPYGPRVVLRAARHGVAEAASQLQQAFTSAHALGARALQRAQNLAGRAAAVGERLQALAAQAEALQYAQDLADADDSGDASEDD